VTEIRVVPSLTQDQEAAIAALGDIWEAAHLGLSWRPKTEHIVRYVDGAMAAKVSVLKHCVSVGGENVWVGGIGGVITMPAFQKQGHATALVRYAAGYLLNQLQVPFGLLFCRDALTPFYRRLGWQMVEDSVTVQQPAVSVLMPIHTMYLSCSSLAWPKGKVNLNSEPW
jgi:aminoglycoside 2'-N-acetyltransferase I